jgi:hypothetical protein
MKKIIINVFWATLLILAIDSLGLLMWSLSGQYPQDEVFIGSITVHLINWIF